MSLAEVKKLPVNNLADVVGMLEHTAAKIKTKEMEAPTSIIMVAEMPDGEIRLFGFGDASGRVRTIGLLEMAKLKMAVD